MKIVLVSLLMLFPVFGEEFDWKKIEVDGVDYVSLEQVGEFYHLRLPKGDHPKPILKGSGFDLTFQSGSKVATFNGIKVILKHPLGQSEAGSLLSVSDLRYLVNATMKPRRSIESFDHVILDIGGSPKTNYARSWEKGLKASLTEMGIKVSLVKSEGVERDHWLKQVHGLAEAAEDEGQSSLYLRTTITDGSKNSIKTTVLGKRRNEFSALGMAIHWVTLNRAHTSQLQEISLLDDGFTLGSEADLQEKFSKLMVPAIGISLNLEGKNIKTKHLGEIRAGAVADGIHLYQKNQKRLAEKAAEEKERAEE